MTTTTIRVDTETHARLVVLAARRGASLMDTVRAATEALRRQEFGGVVATELEALRQNDPVGWAAYLAEAEATAVGDGIR